MANKKTTRKTTSKKRKASANESGSPALWLLTLLVCALILAAIVIMPKLEDNNDNKDTDTQTIDSDTDAASTDVVETDIPVTDAKTEEITEEPPKADEVTTSDIGYTVDTEVETQKDDNGGASMEYPTITPENDTVDAEFINKLIRDYMNGKMREEQLSGGEGIYQYNITETKTALMTDDFLSILIMGEYDVSHAAHPTLFAYTVNCDLSDKTLIHSDELINDFSPIKENFLNGNFTLEYGAEGLLFETNYEDMIMEYRTEYGIYPDVFFTEDTFGMVIDLVYTLGGYAIFEIPYSEIPGAVYEPTK